MANIFKHAIECRQRLTVLISILLFNTVCFADSSVWAISNGKNTVYLAGTFHMLKESDYPLPKEFEQAYQKVNWLVFETNIAQLATPDFQQKFSQAMRLTAPKKLNHTLSQSTYHSLQQYFDKEGLDLQQYQDYKPQMVSLIITMHELRKLGLTAQGVDDFFNQKAVKDSKVTTQLESMDDQIRYISEMGIGNEDNLIKQTLADLQGLDTQLDDMSSAWRTGNRELMNSTGIKPMREDYPKIYDSLLVERNNNWLPKIKRLISHPEEKLIMVGALHLIGQQGLLQQLQRSGYTVTQLSTK